MAHRLRLLALTALFLAPAGPAIAGDACRIADRTPPSQALVAEIAGHNDRAARARLAGDADGLIAGYAPDSILMPEHQIRLFGRAKAGEYYRTMFSRLDFSAYSLATADILPLPNGAVEWGTFTLTYVRVAGGEAQSLRGKYMHLWSRQDDGTLALKSEVWGFDAPLGPLAADWQFAVEAGPAPRQSADPKVSGELAALNAANARSVRNHDTSRIDAYAQDAVYLPYAAAPQVGHTAIREHLVPYIEAGRGATFSAVTLSNDRFETTGPYVIEHPNFEVHWSAGASSGISSGGGLRVWRREADCSLKMIRQIGVHHRP